MKKKIIRLTENDLHNIVKSATKKIIKEFFDNAPMSSDDEWLSNADDEDDYNNRESTLLDKQHYKGEDAMNYHPQRNRSTIAGEDFASTYARDPMFNNRSRVDMVTKHPRRNFGF